MTSIYASSLPRHRLNGLLAAALLWSTGVFAAGLSFEPAALDFGANALGEVKKLTAKLRNSTTVDIVLADAHLVNNAAGFSFTTMCGAVLPAGQNCAYSVEFKPKSLKLGKTWLEVATGDPAFPLVKLPLSGNLYPALNDTGVTRCANADSTNQPCPQVGFSGQDAEQGRDRTRNKGDDGHVGFNFTKLDAKGRALPASANSWSCVRDNVTGLVWESKENPDGIEGNQGLHDGDDKFTGYSTDDANNNGYRGEQDRAYIWYCHGYQPGKPSTYCNTEAYVKRVNATGWCGAQDWRLPTRKELHGLVDHGVAYDYWARTIDTRYFPDTLSHWYWTSSSFAGNSHYTYIVSFTTGYADGVSRSQALPVRLVRTGASVAASR